jgi:hypothetical protein
LISFILKFPADTGRLKTFGIRGLSSEVVIFLPYLQMSKNLRRDFALGEALDPRILHNRKMFGWIEVTLSDQKMVM